MKKLNLRMLYIYIFILPLFLSGCKEMESFGSFFTSTWLIILCVILAAGFGLLAKEYQNNVLAKLSLMFGLTASFLILYRSGVFINN